ncbi:MAG: 3-phosphoshikimate 1-carboxyvinyltransferase [Saprospiraceae bacterium]|nr:3-phosphoshikimate 1-carboxyvinyltransferase [Saprospiraceae bacterium]
MNKLILRGPQSDIDVSLTIGGSKSITNRVLLIRALSGNNFEIENLSNSDDSQTMMNLFADQDQHIFDCHHAGTTFRFLTAYFSLQKGEQILTGSARMKNRPIGPLVDALRSLGAHIEYLEKEGYPPLKIRPFNKQKTKDISIKADISSQFISALCMIGPSLKQGISIKLEGELVSQPYLEMTLKIMSDFGIKSNFENQQIHISSQRYESKKYLVESDWSSASYHFAIAALKPNSKILLNHFFEDSLQGDSAITKMAQSFGVQTTFNGTSLLIQSDDHNLNEFNYDFIEQPDIAQTIAVMAAGKGISVFYNGLKTLRIKETDRIEALQNELKKINVNLIKSLKDHWEFEQFGFAKINNPVFDTYQDHRMAMSFAPLAILGNICINEPEVVSKSYPDFWDHLKEMGFKLEVK